MTETLVLLFSSQCSYLNPMKTLENQRFSVFWGGGAPSKGSIVKRKGLNRLGFLSSEVVLSSELCSHAVHGRYPQE